MRTIVKLFQITTAIGLLVSTVAAQGSFLEQGEYGLGFEGGKLWINNGYGSYGGVGYSFKNIEIGLNLENIQEDGDRTPDKIGSIGVAFLSRQSASRSILGIIAHFGLTRNLNAGEKVNMLSFGASIFRNHPLTSSLFVQPRLGFAGGLLFNSKNTVRSFLVTGVLDASLNLAVRAMPRLMLVAGPGWAYNTDARISVWGISAAVILVTKK